jgi:hypothetical protein
MRSALQAVLTPSSSSSSSPTSSSSSFKNSTRSASRERASVTVVRAHPNPSLYDVVDEEKMLSESTFPIKPDELIELTKENLRKGFANIDLSEDFEFIGPVVGPLSKETFVNAVAGFELAEGFPDMKSQFHHFRVDPFETNRVWFQNRTVGTHTGVLAGNIQPTGKKVECPPQALSLTFNEKGEVTKITVGVVMDRTIGNTGGLGGVFGLFYAVGAGLPFPEAQPWKKSKRYRFFTLLGNLASKMKK